MSTKSYMPLKEELLLSFFDTFTTQIDQVAGTLGLTPEIVAALKADGHQAMTSISDVLSKRIAYAASVATKNTSVGTAKAFYLNQVSIIKKLPGYNDTIGAMLGIVPPVVPFDPTTYQAEITRLFNSAPGQVTVRFAKAFGNIEGVRMYRQLVGQADWVDLGFKMYTPFIDNTPLVQPGVPEMRRYRCCAVIGDQEVGLMSAEKLVAVS